MGTDIEIREVLKELHQISGFRISLHDTEFGEIAAYPENLTPFCACIQRNPKAKRRCLEADAEASRIAMESGGFHLYKCRFGLYEAVAPLYHFGVLSGYLMMGQITDTSPDNYETIMNLSKYYANDKEELSACIKAIQPIAFDMITSYIKIMTICAEYITLSGKMSPNTSELAPLIKKYINIHFMEKLSLSQLCHRFGCSKTTLMNSFKSTYAITVNNYITEVRLNHAKTLLATTNETMGNISDSCGFSDQNYFSKVFFRSAGVSPSTYRKIQKKV